MTILLAMMKLRLNNVIRRMVNTISTWFFSFERCRSLFYYNKLLKQKITFHSNDHT
jgi:hypothetical protein